MANSKTSKTEMYAVTGTIDIQIDGIDYPKGTPFVVDKERLDKWLAKGYVIFADDIKQAEYEADPE